MNLLVDANLSPRIVAPLQESGYRVTHVKDTGLLTAEDSEIFDWAATREYVVVTADSDFTHLLALRRATRPSVIFLRQVSELAPMEHADLLVANLPTIAEDLEAGAVVSLSPTRMAVRRLPIV